MSPIRLLGVGLLAGSLALTACGGGATDSPQLDSRPAHDKLEDMDDGGLRPDDVTESVIYPGDDVDYVGGEGWYVDGVKVTGVDCPEEDSCYPMQHGDGWMIHEN